MKSDLLVYRLMMTSIQIDIDSIVEKLNKSGTMYGNNEIIVGHIDKLLNLADMYHERYKALNGPNSVVSEEKDGCQELVYAILLEAEDYTKILLEVDFMVSDTKLATLSENPTNMREYEFISIPTLQAQIKQKLLDLSL